MKDNFKKSLIVSHNLFLTKEERYKLVRGETIKITGSNVPVWASKKLTTEPAVEVFCYYIISNDPTVPTKVSTFDQGYLVNMPNFNDDGGKIAIESIPEIEKLKDINDGKGAEYLFFKYIKEVKNHKIFHFIAIKDFKELTNSLSAIFQNNS